MLAVALAWAAEPELADDDDVAEVVVVTASRSESAQGDHPVAVEVVSREEIEASGAESLAEVLEEQPGVQIQRTVTGVSVQLQGLNPEHTLILVDGQRVLGRKDGVIDLSRIALENVERIEIVKGPASALYGSDAMGGVVHIVTKRPSDAREVGLHVRGGTLGRVDATADLSLAQERFGHRIAAGWHGSEAWDLDPSDEATTSSAYQQGDVDYTLTFGPSDDSRIDARVAYMQRRLEGVDGSPTGAILDRRQFVEDARVSVNGWVTPTARTKWSARMSGAWYRDQFLQDQRGATSLDIASDTVEMLTEGTVQLDQQVGAGGKAGRHFLSAGIDLYAQQLASDRLGTGKANRQRVAGFLQDLWTIGDADGTRVQIAPSARVDLDTQFGSAFTPRLALSLSRGGFTARLGGGTGFRAPDFRELYLRFENPGVGYTVAGSPDLRPERSRSGNAGVDWAKGDLSLSLGGFFNDVSNLIQVGTQDIEPGALQVFGYENVARARTGGFETQAKVTPGPLDLDVAYTWTWTRDLDLQRPLENRVPHRLTGGLGLDLPADLTAHVRTGVSSPRTFFEDSAGIEQAVNTEWLVTTDARVAWTDGTFDVFAGVDNVFDARGTALAPLVPRFLYLGFTARGRKEGA